MELGLPSLAIILTTCISATLAVIAWRDWSDRRIPNLAVLLLLICALARWTQLSGLELERTLEMHGINVLLALMIIVPGALKGILGAGDSKLLLALALLWPTDLFLQAFSLGTLALLAICMLMDTLKNSKKQAMDGNSTTLALPEVETMIQRGLPLGTAVSLGAFLATIT